MTSNKELLIDINESKRYIVSTEFIEYNRKNSELKTRFKKFDEYVTRQAAERAYKNYGYDNNTFKILEVCDNYYGFKTIKSNYKKQMKKYAKTQNIPLSEFRSER